MNDWTRVITNLPVGGSVFVYNSLLPDGDFAAMKQPRYFLATLAFLCGAAQQCWAGDVLFNDFGSGYSYNIGNGWLVSGSTSSYGAWTEANEFTPTTSGTVGSVAFGVSLSSGTNAVTMELAENNGGAPGTILESYTFTGQMGTFGSQNSPLIASSLLNPYLTAGTKYWIVAVPGASDTVAAWNLNNQGATGTELYSNDGEMTWNNYGKQPLGAFEILSVPEPGTVSLLGLGLAGIVGYGRLRRQQRSGDC
jgi:hypothetical protein